MPLDRQSPSPSKIPSFYPTPAEVSSPASLKAAACSNSSSADIVKQLLDELISSAALLAAGDAVQTPVIKAKLGHAGDSSSRASGVGRSAITALTAGIDATSHEPASIEAMEALCSMGDDESLLVLSSLQQHSNQGTTLQELADMCSSTDLGSLEAEGPADSWLRASSDFSAPPSASGTAATAGTSPADLALNMHGPSWDEYVSDMGTKLHTSACHAPLVPAAEAAAQGSAAAAAVRTAPAALDTAAGAYSSSSSRQGGLKAAAATAAASHGAKGGSYAAATAAAAAAGSPKGAAGAGRSGNPAGGYAVARTPVRHSPRSPTPSGKPGVVASPRSPGSASLVPPSTRTRIPQQQQQPQHARGVDRSDSLSKPGSSRIPSALSPPPAAQPAPVAMAVAAAAAAGGGTLSPGKGAGLDVLLSGTRRHSSSDNGSSASSRKGSGGGSGPRDEASAAWMSSLRSGAPSSCSGSRKAVSRSSSTAGATAAAATPPLSTRSSSRQLHSIRSGRTPRPALDSAPAAAVAMTPPAGIRSSRSTRTTPRSSIDSSSGKHAHLSLRRSGSLRSASDSPTAAALRSSSGRVLSPYTEQAVPLPLAFEAAAAAAEIPEDCQAPVVSGTGIASAFRGLAYSILHSSVDGAGVGHLAADACIESWLQPGRAAAAPSAGSGLASMGGASSLLSSDGEIMADPTAVQLFMELNEEIEAEGKAAMAASAAAKTAAASSSLSSAASAAAVAPAAAMAVAFGAPAAAEVRSGSDGARAAGVTAGSRRVSSHGASGQLAGEASGTVQQPAGEASWGSGGAEDLRHSVSPECQGVQRTSNTGAERAAPAAASVAAAEGPLPADELRVSNTVDTRLSASSEAPLALTSKAEGAADSSAAAAAVAAAVAPVHVPGGGLSQQASSHGGSDADAQAGAHEEQPSCGCKCVIM